MRALIHEGEGRIRYTETLTVREPDKDEVLVRIVASGICHSDISVMNGTIEWPAPAVLGHEGAGVIEKVGASVTGLQPGDHVVLHTLAYCGHCAHCDTGKPTHCRSTLGNRSQPFTQDGAAVSNFAATSTFAEYTVVKQQQAVKVHPDIPLDVACVVGCAVQTGVGAVLNTARVREGDTVLVMGAGGIGLSIIQGARLAGAARIIVSEPDAQRRATALAMGATHAIDPTADDLLAATLDLSPGGIGADVAFDAVGRSALVAAGIDATRKGGTTVMVGVPGLEDPFTYPLPAVLAIGEKKLVGSLLGSCNSLRDIPRLIDLMQQGRLDLASLITARRPLDEINQAFDDIRSTTGIRTVIDL